MDEKKVITFVKLLIVVVVIGVGLFGGFWYAKNTSKSTKNVIYLGKIDSFDGKTLKYSYENGSSRTLSDISKITVWKSPNKRGSVVDLKPGSQIKIASDKLTGQISAILIL